MNMFCVRDHVCKKVQFMLCYLLVFTSNVCKVLIRATRLISN